MANKTYNLHCGDMFGRNDRATEILNNEFVPMIKKMGIRSDDDLDAVFKVLSRIVEEACSNASYATEWEVSSGEGV